MLRSEITIDLGAVRHNVRRLLSALAGSQLWAVVKADAYGHGAVEVARVALDEGARALCVATVGEGVALRSAFADVRIVVMGPSGDEDIGRARDGRLELAVSEPPFPEGIPLHLKLDTGMGRLGAQTLPEPPPNAVGLMSHLATADVDPAFAELQLERFRAAAAALPRLGGPHREQRRHAAAAWVRRLRGRTLRGRAVRPVAVPGAPVLGRPRARSVLAELARAGEAPRRGREHRLRPPLRSRAADVDRARARGLRGRLPQGPHRDRRARRRRASPGGRHRVDGLVRGRAARRAASRHPRHAHRRRAARSRATPPGPGRSTTRSRPASGRPPSEPGACSSMADLTDRLREALAGGEGWLVGGALRDELLGRPVVDLDVACREPEIAARAFARAERRRAVSALGAPWRLADRARGRANRRLHAARGGDRGRPRDPRLHAQRDGAPRRRRRARRSLRRTGGHRRRTIRAVGSGIFEADPLRLLRAVRLEDELGFRCDDGTEALVRRHASLAARPAGERILGELERLSAAGFRRLAEVGLLEALGGSDRLFDRIDAVDSLRLPARVRFRQPGLQPSDLAEPRPVRAHAAPRRASGRRLRARDPPLSAGDRAVGARRARVPRSWPSSSRRSRKRARNDPAGPLLRGDELGLPPGPEIGRLLGLIAEERAAGTITTKEEALELVRRRAR